MVTIQRTNGSNPGGRDWFGGWGTAPSLDATRSGAALMQNGMQGDSVRAVQRRLGVEADGMFGRDTERAVVEFQRRNGLGVDGIVGPETMAALEGRGRLGERDQVVPPRRSGSVTAPSEAQLRERPSGTVPAGDLARNDELRRHAPRAPGRAELAPAGASQREKFEHYAGIVRAAGGQVNPNGQPTVLALRDREQGASREYGTRFVVLQANGRVTELNGATHPGQSRSSLSPDINRDGRGDVGMIAPGNYSVVPNGNHAGMPSYHVRTTSGSGRIPGWRDTNQDGVYSSAERQRSAGRGDYLTEVLFHAGGASSPSSIGCQTFPPSEMRRLIDAVGGPRGRFNFTLVER